MKWGEEIDEKPFLQDVEKAVEVVKKIDEAVKNPLGGEVIVYEYEKWWKLGKDRKPVKQMVKLDPTNQAELARYQNIADMLKNYAQDPNRHSQIGPLLKRTFEEEK